MNVNKRNFEELQDPFIRGSLEEFICTGITSPAYLKGRRMLMIDLRLTYRNIKFFPLRTRKEPVIGKGSKSMTLIILW